MLFGIVPLLACAWGAGQARGKGTYSLPEGIPWQGYFPDPHTEQFVWGRFVFSPQEWVFLGPALAGQQGGLRNPPMFQAPPGAKKVLRRAQKRARKLPKALRHHYFGK